MTARPFLCITWAGVLCNTYREAIPSVHTSGVRTCRLWASECAHLGRPILHTSGLRICTIRTSERAQFGRPNVHTSGVATCIFRAPEGAHFGRPNVHSSGVRTCTLRASECDEPAAQRRRVTIAQHYCRGSPQQAQHPFSIHRSNRAASPGAVLQNIGFAGTPTETVTEPPRFADVLTETVTETVTETIVITGIFPRARENVF